MDTSLYENARAGHLVLTVNDRLARHLLREYDLVQRSQGLTAWLRPEILSLAAWLSRNRSRLPGFPLFLNNSQLQHVWETLIEADTQHAGNALLQVPQTARRALQAHQLLIRHAARFDAGEAAEDHRAFLRWRKGWQSLAAERGWHDPAELPWLLADAIDKQLLPLPARIIFAGFDEITPDLDCLRAGLAAAGTLVRDWQARPCRDVRLLRLDAADAADEVSRCARWIRRLLADNPAARIGVVAPQLEVYRPLVETLFAAELEAELMLVGSEAPRLFNLSLGQGLDREGVVHAALKLLRIARRVTQEDLSWLLLTPYAQGALKEQQQRAQLDRELRRLRRFDWPLAQLLKALTFQSARQALDVPELFPLVEELVAAGQSGGKRLPSDWAEHFTVLLRNFGWPGPRGLSSREYQAVARFRAVLGELASLDGVAQPLSRSSALATLAHMVNAVEFQPEGAAETVQILGELESSGMTFDHLWILGLHDGALPNPPSPNPFIPLPVQRRHHMKRADAEREHHFASQVTARLFCAAPDIVCSWPRREKGAEQRPSPFLADIIAGQPALAESTAAELLLWLARPELETLVDSQGPPLALRKPFAGGTGIIKDQALCPFRAFAHHRLGAECLEIAEIGIDSMARGSLAHSVLELFWAKVIDQETLLSLDAATVDEHLQSAAAAALTRLEKERRADLPQRQRRIEQQRLVVLVRQWLDFERRRAPFRVLAAEKSRQIRIGSLAIRARIDRLDELADGSCAVIDYKTGRPDVLQWLNERVTEPQLPVYCLSLPRDQVGGVMFAVVRGKVKESGFCGLARDLDDWPEAKSRALQACLDERGLTSFAEVLAHWDKTLPALGDAFARGDAAVDPVDRELACQYCDLKSLCRILEQQSAAGGTPDD